MGITCSSSSAFRQQQIYEELVEELEIPELEIPEPERSAFKVDRLLALLERPANPLRLNEMGRILSSWDSDQKFQFAQRGGLLRLMDIIATNSYQKGQMKILDEKLKNPAPQNQQGSQNDSEAPVGAGLQMIMASYHPAQGVGYGHGSTSTAWNLKKTLEERRRDEMIVTAALRFIRSFLYKAVVDYCKNSKISLTLREKFCILN